MAAASASTASIASVISDGDSWMTDAEKALATTLLEADQGHLFSKWTSGADEDKKHAFFEQVRRRPSSFLFVPMCRQGGTGSGSGPHNHEAVMLFCASWVGILAVFAQIAMLESGYPGGIKAYVAKAQELLAASARGENPFAGFTPEVRLARFA
jgi:hypothetical protein